MKIIAVIGDHPTSEGIIADLAHIAGNTWADIIMLGVQSPDNGDRPEQSLITRMRRCREAFMRHFPGNESSYCRGVAGEAFVPVGRRCWTLSLGERKGDIRGKLSVRIRIGDPVREILAESRMQQPDLVILGCTKDGSWQRGKKCDLPRKIAATAGCSVLVIREMERPRAISCFLGQGHVSQASLEMVNQIVTLYQAELTIVGLVAAATASGEEEIKQRIAGILKYYAQRRIRAWLRLALPESVEEDVCRAGEEGMIALWMGKKNLFGKFFSRDLIGQLVCGSQPAVLILR